MATIKVRRLKQIPAEITVPGDKSISHRAAMFAGLANGRTEISGFLPSEDCICTVHAMEAMGAKVEWLEETARRWLHQAGDHRKRHETATAR